MRAEFPSGCTVSRAYNDGDEAELIALFAYATDAEEFAKAKISEDAASATLICGWCWRPGI